MPSGRGWSSIGADAIDRLVFLGAVSNNDMPMPEHGVIFLTTESADEAYYIAGVLNSEPVGTIISG